MARAGVDAWQKPDLGQQVITRRAELMIAEPLFIRGTSAMLAIFKFP
jgi:hypothetical protein